MTRPRPSARSRPPTPREKAENLADEGRIADLVQELAGWTGTTFRGSEEAALIRRAVAHHTGNGVQATFDAAFLAAIGLNLECLARTQLGMLRRLEQIDQHHGAQACSAPPPALQDDLQRLAAIEDTLLDLLRRFATARHTLALSEPDRAGRSSTRTRTTARVVNAKVIDFAEAAKAIGDGNGA